jgi:hypothetical protein
MFVLAAAENSLREDKKNYVLTTSLRVFAFSALGEKITFAFSTFS